MEFEDFGKIPRLFREITITEKIDGTNACIAFDNEMNMFVGSRNRWITPDNDNYGFALWCQKNKEELIKLGPGRHFGEWWGVGINRGYDLSERRFSLFNTIRWFNNPDLPKCCRVVPIIYEGYMVLDEINLALELLRDKGSMAEKGYMKPEGIIIYHKAGRNLYKVTLEKDSEPKNKNKETN